MFLCSLFSLLSSLSHSFILLCFLKYLNFFQLISDFALPSFPPKMQFSFSSCQSRLTSLLFFSHLLLFFFPAAVSHQYFCTCRPPLVSFAPSLLLHRPRSERLSATPLRVCELLGLNDFLLPPPVNSAPFDQANEIENFHLGQIDFKPEITCDPNEEQQEEERNAEMLLSLNTKQLFFFYIFFVFSSRCKSYILATSNHLCVNLQTD